MLGSLGCWRAPDAGFPPSTAAARWCRGARSSVLVVFQIGGRLGQNELRVCLHGLSACNGAGSADEFAPASPVARVGMTGDGDVISRTPLVAI